MKTRLSRMGPCFRKVWPEIGESPLFMHQIGGTHRQTANAPQIIEL